ncbi:hypothetical protein [Sphingomonas sp.]|uniref:hypothetical protein n=1 Tax=Sphingomonas sp. TaxID=28214 RepID=UPI002FD970C0
MGREVRRVPADWQHPKTYNEYRREMTYVPLFEGSDYEQRAAEWDEEWAKWQDGICRAYGDGPEWEPIEEKHRHMRYTDYAGSRPSPDDYMPNWPKEQRTHLMMYEDTSEGTPISPAFETPEELARWLADNNASAFAGDGASYEHWLPICRGGWAPSMIMAGGVMMSGVEGMAELRDSD